MGDVINLRLVRKQKERLARGDEAQQNRVAHGRTKSERASTEAQARLHRDRLDAHRLVEKRAPDKSE